MKFFEPISSVRQRVATTMLTGMLAFAASSQDVRAVFEPDGSDDSLYIALGQQVQGATGGASLYAQVQLDNGRIITVNALKVNATTAVIPMHAIVNLDGTAATVLSVGNGLNYISSPGEIRPVLEVRTNANWNYQNPFMSVDMAVIKFDYLSGGSMLLAPVGSASVGLVLTGAGRGVFGTPSTGYQRADGNVRGFNAPVMSVNPGNVSDSFYTTLRFSTSAGVGKNGRGEQYDSGGIVIDNTAVAPTYGLTFGMMVGAEGGLNPLGSTTFLDFTKPATRDYFNQIFSSVPLALSINAGTNNPPFRLTLTGPAGSNAVISASTNLQTWVPLLTNTLTGGSLNFTDTLATNYLRRFYRANLQ